MVKLTKDIDLTDHVLVIASVAVGNVGQLAADLLISNLNLQLIGSVSTTAFIPIVGLNPYKDESKQLCTAADIYASTEKKVVVIQIRSFLVNGPSTFFHDLLSFATQHKIAKVIILTGSYGYEKEPTQISQLRYIGSETIISENIELFEKLQWIKYGQGSTVDTNMKNKVSIPGGGIASSLYTFLTAANIPCAVLFKFCFRENNTRDAFDLISYLNQWMKLLETDNNGHLSITYPSSWKYLFGNPPPSDMY